MSFIIVIIVCLILFFYWMIYEMNHAQELPPDFDYDKVFNEALKKDNKKAPR